MKNLTARFTLPLLTSALCLLAFNAPSQASEEPKAEPAQTANEANSLKQISVTAAYPITQPLVLSESSVGKVISLTAPNVAAKAGGEIIEILADIGSNVQKGQTLAKLDDTDYQLEKQAALAEIHRLESLIPAQQLQVQRFENLMAKNSSSQSKLDDAAAQLGALQAQLSGAKVRLSQVQRKISHCKITSPISGTVNQRFVSQGDFIQPGTPVFQLVDNQNLQAILPFPERLLSQIQPGLVVLLTSSMHPNQTLSVKITDIRPMIDANSHSIEAIANFNNTLNWAANGSVSAQLILSEQAEALWVPEQSVVARPNGKVVFVIQNGLAKQQAVTTGEQQTGRIQILTGLTPQDEVVVSGAGFLTDNTPVKIANKNTH